MKKQHLVSFGYAAAMSVLWSVVFYNILGTAGIGVGICLGASCFATGTLMFKHLDKKKEDANSQTEKDESTDSN